MKLKTIFVLAIFSLSLGILFVPNDADARRMGGGRSFGGSSRMLNTAPKPNVAAPTIMQRSTQQNNVTATGAGAVGATRSRGMMGGMFGGLLAGSLIGSMLMGGGFAGGSLLDIILIGGLIFLGYKLFFRRRPQQMQNMARQNTAGQQDLQNNTTPSVQNFQLRTPTTRTDIGSTKTETDEFYAEHFDKAEFLRGAKILYVRLQEAWDKRDLDDIAVFSTEAVMKELRKQKEEDPTPSQTEIIVVNAYLQAIDRDGIFERAAVHFNVRLREDSSSEKTEEVDEIWHFIRNADAKDSWKLDGIQQTQ